MEDTEKYTLQADPMGEVIFNGIPYVPKSALATERSNARATLLSLREQMVGKIPTKETKVTIHSGPRDPHDTTPESLVAMGYWTAIRDCIGTLDAALQESSK